MNNGKRKIGRAVMWMAAASLGALSFSQGAQADEPPARFEYAQIQMGVPFRITLYAADEGAANEAARAAFARIKVLNRVFSDYDPDSELMRLCRASGPERPVPVSPELFDVLRQSVEWSRRSDGAFDVTVGPVVRLWRRARRTGELPDPDLLADALSRVGYAAVVLDAGRRAVELRKEGVRLDLGGIAKGYAADEALAVLRRHGIRQALVDGGGDISLGDPPPGASGWRIGIAPVDRPDDPPEAFLVLSHAAVATSGDAYQHFEIAGTRYSHLVDPRTGLGLTQPRSVTVIAADGATADALASCLSVLDPERGLELADATEGAAARIVQAEGGDVREFTSARWGSYFARGDAESAGAGDSARSR